MGFLGIGRNKKERRAQKRAKREFRLEKMQLRSDRRDAKREDKKDLKEMKHERYKFAYSHGIDPNANTWTGIASTTSAAASLAGNVLGGIANIKRAGNKGQGGIPFIQGAAGIGEKIDDVFYGPGGAPDGGRDADRQQGTGFIFIGIIILIIIKMMGGR